MHGLLSLQSATVGHLPGPAEMPVSQSSPPSRIPLPHTAEQSASLVLLQPDGQQPSLVVPLQAVMSWWWQRPVQLAAEPV